MRKGFWKDYFSFTIRERSALLVLLLIIVVFIFLPGFFAPKFKDVTVDTALQLKLDSITSTLANTQPARNPDIADFNSENKSPALAGGELHPFDFDPNTLPAQGFRKMGLRDKIIQTILSYRNKNGVFRQPDDIRKIYGLTAEEADQLIPFIKIGSGAAATPGKATAFVDKNGISPKQQKTIDINAATEEEWKSLPGIGDVLSKRIDKFRNAVNGFKAVEDVKKTYGLTDSTYQVILPYLAIGEKVAAEN